jgi:hypothetical protein
MLGKLSENVKKRCDCGHRDIPQEDRIELSATNWRVRHLHDQRHGLSSAPWTNRRATEFQKLDEHFLA